MLVSHPFPFLWKRTIKQNRRKYDIPTLEMGGSLSIELYLEKVLIPYTMRRQFSWSAFVVCYIFHKLILWRFLRIKWKEKQKMAICHSFAEIALFSLCHTENAIYIYFLLMWPFGVKAWIILMYNVPKRHIRSRDHSIWIDLWMKPTKNTLRKYTAFTLCAFLRQRFRYIIITTDVCDCCYALSTTTTKFKRNKDNKQK